MQKKIVTACLVIFYFSIGFAANQIQQKSQELSQVTQKIQTLKQTLFSVQSTRQTIQHQLRDTEITMGKLAGQLYLTQQKINDQQKLLQRTELKLAGYRQQLEEQKELLIQQTRAAYLLGQQPLLKILLNQQNPEEMNRFFHYYHYFYQARMDVIHRVETLSAEVKETIQSIEEQTIQLRQNKDALQQQKIGLLQQQNHRHELLRVTNKTLHDKNQKLKKLLNNQQALSKIIDRLKEEAQYGYAPGKAFDEMRGKLLWPVLQGHVLQYFGQASFGGRIRSSGLLIQAFLGSPVHVIYPGKVIFADWLKGFGLLVIVQHGQRYMSIYARNQSLLVNTNDNVDAGQVIATVGKSGGFQKDALYFEIRDKGQPVNPAKWLTKMRG